MLSAAARITARWKEIAGVAFSVGEAQQRGALERLVAAYQEMGRHYHDLGHIAALLELSSENRARLVDSVTVDLAILYHDAVYDPLRSDNEAASAELAEAALKSLGAGRQRIDTVARYIRATAHMAGIAEPAGRDGDLDHLLDLDLSVLAAEAAVYDAYSAAIRREYLMYPDAAYAQGRSRVLAMLLAQPALFRVDHLARCWEARARINIGREIARLEQGRSPPEQ